VTQKFWFLPALCAFTAVVAAIALTELDGSLGGQHLPVLFPGGPDGARSVLSAMSSSMIAFTGLTFTITIVVLQLTSSQFSPRVLRSFLDDRGNQLALGMFIAVFTYALLVMRSVRGAEEGDAFVPRVAITFAFILLLASIGMFLYYIHHMANSIRVVNIIERIAKDTRETIDRCYPADGEDGEGPRPVSTPDGVRRTVRTPRPGVLDGVDTSALVRLAESADCTIALRHPIGVFVRTGSAVLDVGATRERLSDEDLLAAVEIRDERTLDQDVAFGFRQLVDIADRALSPGINDPTTALQVIDQLRDLLVRLVTRPTPTGRHIDDDGRCRLVVPMRAWDDYLDQAVDEIVHYGADTPRVLGAVGRMLDDLADAAPEERRAGVLRKQAAVIGANGGARQNGAADVEDHAWSATGTSGSALEAP